MLTRVVMSTIHSALLCRSDLWAENLGASGNRASR